MKKFLATALAWLLFTAVCSAATLLPNGKQTFLDSNGQPLVGGTVTFYVPGTTSPKDTYQDPGGTVPNTNPVLLDAAGRAIIYGAGAYREVVKDSAGNLIWDQLTGDSTAANSSWGGQSGGTANSQTISASNFTSSDGQAISFIAGFTNTTALSLNPNNNGPISVLKDTPAGSVTLTGGEIIAGSVQTVTYDASRGAFHLTYTAPLPSAPASLAATATTNLGVIYSHIATITGSGVSITSFGSSCSTTIPIYWVTFSGANTLVYNATSMLLPNGTNNITTAAGDAAILECLGSGNWQVLNYTKADGTTFVPTVPRSSVRQTVTSGPSTTGTSASAITVPNFLTTAGSLTAYTTVNIASGTPFSLSAAAGFNGSGPADFDEVLTANFSFGTLAGSTTDYLWRDPQAHTAGNSTLQPLYQCGGTISTVNDQFTFDYCAYQGWLGNGSSSVASTRVYVGEVDTSASAVTAVRPYAYDGQTETTPFTTAPNYLTYVGYTHNIGAPTTGQLVWTITSSFSGYVAGDEPTIYVTNAVGAYAPIAAVTGRMGAGFQTSVTTSNIPFYYSAKNASGSVANNTINAGASMNGNVKMIIRRIF